MSTPDYAAMIIEAKRRALMSPQELFELENAEEKAAWMKYITAQAELEAEAASTNKGAK
jgi:hypothetical protein